MTPRELTTVNIASQKAHIKEIKDLCDKIAKYQKSSQESQEPLRFTDDELTSIVKALCYHWGGIQIAVDRQIKAREYGAEDGNLRSHGEKDILKGCISLIDDAVVEAKCCLADHDDDQDEKSGKFDYSESYMTIVRRLFLWNTPHSGNRTTRAKCRELGVDPNEVVKFAKDFLELE